LLWGVVAASSVSAEEGPSERLIDRAPFDQVILDEANRGAVLDVAPLDISNRQMPAPRPSGNLKLTLVDDPSADYEVPWANVAEIRFYERRLLEEARRLTAENKFDEAFDYFERLLTDYKTLPGLNEAANDYLHRNALALSQDGHYERALAVLQSLYQRDPKYSGLSDEVDAAAGKLIEQQVRKQDYSAARAVLALWQKQFPELPSRASNEWERRFTTAAERKLDEAQRLVNQQQFVAARRTIATALSIWPKLPAANHLLAEIQQQNRFVIVAVTEPSPEQPVQRLDSWPALRTGRLVEPTLAELVGFNSEGGVYRSPFGQLRIDESGRQVSLQFDSAEEGLRVGGRLSADTLARYFLAMAEPTNTLYRSTLAGLLAGVSIDGDGLIRIELTRPHVRPDALLQVPLPQPTDLGQGENETSVPAGHWKLSAASEPGSMVFESIASARGGPRGQVRTIIEQTMPDDEAAVKALLAGAVDVLDRVPPWQVARLRAADDVRVGTYGLPTVHVLIPNASRPLPASREFRRALCYGIDRKQIVQQVLLAGDTLPGFEVLSGPFPTGLSLSDPVRYAYNSRLEPRPYEPRLAAVLATIAWYNVLDPKGEGKVELTDVPQLVLAHPADPVARVACQTIQLQLERVGIPIKLQEFTADDLLAGRVECDLRYAELAMWEPVVDAARLLGPDGLASSGESAQLDAALRRLGAATNWKDVRARLAEIHEIAYHDLPVIPLWQTAGYFAYRTSVRGIGQKPITLYQDVDEWDIVPEESSGTAVTGR
jgi:peptide/nickel transport system substrate-binding protein